MGLEIRTPDTPDWRRGVLRTLGGALTDTTKGTRRERVFGTLPVLRVREAGDRGRPESTRVSGE